MGFRMLVPRENTDEIRKLAAEYGGKPAKGGFRFTGEAEEELGQRVLVFLSKLPPEERTADSIRQERTAEGRKRAAEQSRLSEILNKRLLPLVVRGINQGAVAK